MQKFGCDDDYLFSTLFDLVQISELSIISLASQINQNFDKDEKIVFSNFIATLFDKASISQKFYNQLNVSEIIEEAQVADEVSK